MIHRERLHRPGYVYPTDPWRFVETRFYPRYLAQTETFFSLSNGYLGIRGAFEEGTPAYCNATLVNGFHETWPITYGEAAFGFATTGQTIVNVPDGKIIRLYVDDESFDLATAKLLEFERALDMRRGCLERRVLWEAPSGKMVSIRSTRLVSFEQRHLAAIAYEVTVINDEAPLVIASELRARRGRGEPHADPRRPREMGAEVLRRGPVHQEALRTVVGQTTRSSGMALACGMEHVVETECAWRAEHSEGESGYRLLVSVDATRGEPVTIVKYLTYHDDGGSGEDELCERATRTLDRGRRHGFPALLEGQVAHLDGFWERADIEVDGDPAVQQAVRFNLFHTYQATARAERRGIPAKGLTGLGYEGHYFWDGEIYILPFLAYTHPRLARNLLELRHRQLPLARERARELNQKGALFPWRTISGEEASAYYAAGTAQYHINAAIVHALGKYVEVTGDLELMEETGAEILVEIARLWTDLGFYSERRGGRFCIGGVTGPDEYNTVVDNNAYTNLMARDNLRFAASTVRHLQAHRTVRHTHLVDHLGLAPDEPDAWERVADAMYVPYDEALGIHLQDDGFLDRKPWDLSTIPRERFPLLLHYHPLVIYRHQVIKQADVVLAMFLLGAEFSIEQKRRNFEFYDELTTGDSSLSASVQSIVAFEVGNLARGWDYARYAALMDLADVGGNTADGLHIASMGGMWMVMVYGIAGLRDDRGRFAFCPRLPAKLRRVRFRLRRQGKVLEVDVTPERTRYHLLKGERLELEHTGEALVLTAREPVAERATECGEGGE